MKGTPRSQVSPSPSPKARPNLTIKTTKLDEKRASFDKTTPRRTQSPHYQRPSPKAADIQAYDRVLFDQLVTLMTVIMKVNLVKTSHDSSLLQDQVQQRAIESVNEGLAKIIVRLEFLQGPCPSHRMTACTQLFSLLMDDINMSVFNDDKHKINVLKKEQSAVKEAASQAHETLTLKVAKKDQQISTLEYDLAMSETKNKTLSKAIELLEKELEKSQHSVTETHQKAIELRMQGWDFKYEVDRRCEKILESVASRMGFVPAGIQKQVAFLKVLKPPGDPEYDLVRNQSSKTRRSSKKKKNNNAAMKSTDNPMLQTLLGGTTSGTQITMNRFASTPTHSEDSQVPPSHNTKSPTSNGVNLSHISSSSQPQSYQQYLVNSAEKDFKNQNRFNSSKIGIADESHHDHRRLSASSNASGYTDRRSSTTSNSSAAYNKSVDVPSDVVEVDDESEHYFESSHDGVKYREDFAKILEDTKPFTTGEIVQITDADFEENDDDDEGDGDDVEALEQDYEQFDSKIYEDEDSSSDDENKVEVQEEIEPERAHLSTAIEAATRRMNKLEESYESRVSRQSKDTAGARALRTASGSQSPGSNRKLNTSR